MLRMSLKKMATLQLECFPFVGSCTETGDLIGATETVYIITKDGIFTDDTYAGFVSATVTSAFKECEDCYTYNLETTGALPDGVAALAPCDVLTLTCDPADLGTPCCDEPMVTVTAGTSSTDTSGGSVTLPYGDNIHFWSDTLAITVEPGSAVVRIEGVATSVGTGGKITGVNGGTIIPPV